MTLREESRKRIAELLSGEIERISEQGHIAHDIAEAVVLVEVENILSEMKD